MLYKHAYGIVVQMLLSLLIKLMIIRFHVPYNEGTSNMIEVI